MSGLTEDKNAPQRMVDMWHIRGLLAVRLEAKRVSKAIDALVIAPVGQASEALGDLLFRQDRLTHQLGAYERWIAKQKEEAK